MKRAIPIFKKDVKHLWMQILVYVATLILFACQDPAYVKHELDVVVGVETSLYVLLPLACWLLVTSLMQAERTVGHNQYWLTRPFSRSDLLAAKLLFLLVFVIAPVFVCQLVVLAANGFVPAAYVGELLVKQIFFLAWLLLPMAAIATVTKNLGHAFLGGLLLMVGLWLCGAFLDTIAKDSGWGGLAWIRETGIAAMALCISAAVVYLQYTRRRTTVSRAVLAIGAAVCLLAAFVPPWPPAFAIQSWFSERKIAPQEVRISLDPEQLLTLRASPDGILIHVGIRWENRPASLTIAEDCLSIESPWRFRCYDRTAAPRPLSEKVLVLPIATDVYQRFRNVPIHVRGSLDLTLSGPPTEPWKPGKCWVEDVYAPYPTSPWFGPLSKCEASEVPVAHIERSFDLGPLRLADAVVVK
jgi:ABC-type transport system involved in multi-copper enzyme maturation permease subunit